MAQRVNPLLYNVTLICLHVIHLSVIQLSENSHEYGAQKPFIGRVLIFELRDEVEGTDQYLSVMRNLVQFSHHFLHHNFPTTSDAFSRYLIGGLYTIDILYATGMCDL